MSIIPFMNRAYCCFLGLLLFLGEISAAETALSFVAGFRQDRLHSLMQGYNPTGTLVFMDDLTAEEIRLYELGVKGKMTFCNQWICQGFANFGKVYKGIYKEKVIGFSADETLATIHGGRSRDISIGLGYQCPILDCFLSHSCVEWLFQVGPIAGWSYDYLAIKMSHAEENHQPDPALDGLVYKNRVQGPWIGLSGLCSIWRISVKAGYEYHWANWHASWLLSGPDDAGVVFSDERRAHDCHGNVAYIDMDYRVCSQWDIGLTVKYQKWKAKQGSEKPKNGSFSSLAFPNLAEVKVSDVFWQIFQIQMSLSYLF